MYTNNQALAGKTFLAGVLDSVASHIAVLNERGDIIATNAAWSRFARENDAPWLAAPAGPCNYLRVCDEAANRPHNNEGARNAHAGIQSVIAGQQTEFALKYDCHSPTQQRWFRMRVTRLQGSQGGVVIAHENITEDVTASKVHEQRLLESHTRFEKLAGAAFEGIAIIDGSRIIDCNQQLSEMFGYGHDEMVGMDLASLVVSENRDEVFGNIRRHIDTDEDMLARRKDGSIIEIEAHGRTLLQDGRELRIKVIRDVTDRHRTERTLRAVVISTSRATGEVYFQKLVESLACNLGLRTAVVGKIVDPENPRIIRTLAVWSNRLIPNFEYDLHGTPCEILLNHDQSVIKERAGALFPQDHIRSAARFESYIGVPVTGATNKVVGVLFVADERPMTETGVVETILKVFSNRVMAELERLEAEAQRSRISQLAVQADKMLAIGGLAAGMAHEINNPLAIMMQNAEVIASRTSPDDPRNRAPAEQCGVTIEAIQQYMQAREILQMLSSIRKSGERASGIIKSMLAFSRPRSTQMASHNLHELIDQALELARGDYDLKKTCDFKAVEILRAYDLTMPLLPCHGAEIQQVFLNLFKNAVQATVAKAGAPAPKLVIRTRCEGNYMKVDVEDNGPGVPGSIRKQIFDPFFTTKPPGAGTGLGLFISYFIICESHRGTMTVQSAPSGGARFQIALPF